MTAGPVKVNTGGPQRARPLGILHYRCIRAGTRGFNDYRKSLIFSRNGRPAKHNILMNARIVS